MAKARASISLFVAYALAVALIGAGISLNGYATDALLHEGFHAFASAGRFHKLELSGYALGLIGLGMFWITFAMHLQVLLKRGTAPDQQS